MSIGVVDVKGRDALPLDLNVLAGEITVIGGPQPAPEPSALLLIALGLLAIRRRRDA